MWPSLEKRGSRSKKKSTHRGPPQETERRWLTPIPDSKNEACSVNTVQDTESSSQCLFGARLDLRTSEIGVPTQHSCDDRCRSVWAKWSFFSFFVLPEYPPSCFLTFFNCQDGTVSSFFHSLSTAGNCIRYFHRLRLQKKCMNQIVMGHRSFSFASHVGLHVFFGREDSIRWSCSGEKLQGRFCILCSIYWTMFISSASDCIK